MIARVVVTNKQNQNTTVTFEYERWDKGKASVMGPEAKLVKQLMRLPVDLILEEEEGAGYSIPGPSPGNWVWLMRTIGIWLKHPRHKQVRVVNPPLVPEVSALVRSVEG